MFDTKKNQIGYIAAAIFLIVGAFFMANVEMPAWAHYASAVNIVLFALPVIWALRRWLGWRDALMLFGALGVYALVIETLAIITGYPYGHFGYSDHLGYRLFGYAPWTVAFAWTPLAIGAYAMAASVFRSALPRALFGTILLTAFDLVLDPGAVYLKFWQYADGGWYYGVPWSNFAGWLVSGFIGAIIFEAFIASRRPLLPVPAQLFLSSIFIVFFWTAFAAFAGMALPALIGLGLVVSMAAGFRRRYYAFDEMIVMVDDGNVPIATEKKAFVHSRYTKLHRAFSVFIINSKRELLLQQRAFSKKTWPGVWSNSCCGHVMLHEDIISAGKRRLRYELGLSGIGLEVGLPGYRYTAEKDGIVENEICPVLFGFTDREPSPNADEVASTKWVSWEKFLEDIRDPGCELSPWAIEEAELLAKEPKFLEALNRNSDRRR